MANISKKERLKQAREFERNIFELIKGGYPGDEVVLRPTNERGREIVDVLYRRRGVEMGIEVKLRAGSAIRVYGDNIHLFGRGGVPIEHFGVQLSRYSRTFDFIYFVSNLPVLPEPVVEFCLNGSVCFVSNYSYLYHVIDEVVRRIDLGLTPPEKVNPLENINTA